MPQDNDEHQNQTHQERSEARQEALLVECRRQTTALERIARALEIQVGIFPEKTDPNRG